MSIQETLPNGKVLNFPDNTSQEVINAAVEKFSGPPIIKPLPDGRILNFPAGTSDEVIRQATQRILTEGQAPEGEAPSVGEFFTGRKRIEATPELGTLPEFAVTPEGDRPSIAAGMLSTFDIKAQKDIIKQAIPGVKFETTGDGSTIIEAPTEEGGTRRSVLNRPGASPQDVITSIAQVLAFVPQARLANLGKTLTQKLGLGAAGAAGTEQALQEVGVALGREERDPTTTLIAGLTGGLAETVVPAFQGLRNIRQRGKLPAGAEDVGDLTENIAIAEAATKATGIKLFPGQKTLIPSELEKQSFVAQLSSGTKKAVESLGEQNKAAGEAVENFLASIASDDAVISGAEQVRTAAQGALAKAKNIRAEKVSPIYKDAFFFSKKPVDLAPVRGSIKTSLDELPETGQIAKSLKRIEGLIADKGGKKPSLKLLHNAKLEIDLMLEKVGEGSLGNTTKGVVKDLKNLLLNQMDEASPLYKQARETFAEASPNVVKMQESIVGKIAALDDTQLKQVTSKIFDPSNTVKNIQDAKKAITDISPDAWNSIVRKELEGRIGSIKSIENLGSIDNVPGQMFRAIFPNDKKSKVLFSALDQEGKQNLKFLQTALKRAGLGRPGGSQTALREEIKAELKGGMTQSIRNWFRGPINSLVSTGEDRAFNSRVKVLAEALFDTSWKAEMTKIKSLPTNSPELARAFTQLLNDVETTERDAQ